LNHVDNLSTDDAPDTSPVAGLYFTGDVGTTFTAWQSSRGGVDDIFMSGDYYNYPDEYVTADSFRDAHPALSQPSDYGYWLAWESLRDDRWEIWGTRGILLPAGVEELPSKSVCFYLSVNYPNPFNSGTIIDYEIAVAGEVRLEILNLLGQKVRTIVAERKPAGKHQARWDGLDDHGMVVPSGIYFYRLSTIRLTETRKALLMR
jgi:hypothetical protein